jgi:hypothetical protein
MRTAGGTHKNRCVEPPRVSVSEIGSKAYFIFNGRSVIYFQLDSLTYELQLKPLQSM